MITIEDCIITPLGTSAYEWFIFQDHIHIPFDMSSYAHETYRDLYREFLSDLVELYYKTGSDCYFYVRGCLYAHQSHNPLKANHIRLDKVKLRDKKIELVLNG
jgi:hypothetical protein